MGRRGRRCATGIPTESEVPFEDVDPPLKTRGGLDPQGQPTDDQAPALGEPGQQRL